ncbi:MAG: sulfurtransferase [Gaiellaceae bacterium]
MSRFSHLVDTGWLADHLGDAQLRVFDCTTKLEPAPPDSTAPYEIVSGRDDYDVAHIPGAGFLDIQNELSDPASRLPFTAPGAEHFSAAMSRHGVADGTFVVLYSAGTAAWATRVWWLLRLFGFDNSAVLDGGWERWSAESRAVTQAPAAYPAAQFRARPRPEMLATKDDVLATLEDGSHQLVNTLSEELFRGETASRYGRPGRIPTSKSVPFASLVSAEDGTFLPVAACRQILAEATDEEGPPVITYCGSGITASLVDFVLTGLDRDGGRLYDGSLSEWAPDETLPLERG